MCKSGWYKVNSGMVRLNWKLVPGDCLKLGRGETHPSTLLLVHLPASDMRDSAFSEHVHRLHVVSV